MKLLDVHTMNARAIEEEDILSVTVCRDGDDEWMDFADVAEAMNEFGRDAEVAEYNVDNHGTLHILLAEPEADTPEQAVTEDNEKASNVFDYVCEAIKAANGDSEKLEVLRVIVDSVARNERLSPELRHIEIYLACAFHNDENVLEALDLYYDRGAEETAQHFGWFSETSAPETEPAAQEVETPDNKSTSMTAQEATAQNINTLIGGTAHV